MLQRVILSFLLLFILMFPHLASAKINCPPENLIRYANFSSAEGQQKIWDLVSNTFQYGNKNWQIKFTVYLPEANSSEEALRLGADYLKYQVDFFETPLGIENEDHVVICFYAQQESTYFLRAYS